MRVREASVCQASRVRRVWEGAAESQAHGCPRPSQPAAFTEPTLPGLGLGPRAVQVHMALQALTIDSKLRKAPASSLLTRGKEASPVLLWNSPGSRGLAALLVLSGLWRGPAS